jgi:hypothetical protein
LHVLLSILSIYYATMAVASPRHDISLPWHLEEIGDNQGNMKALEEEDGKQTRIRESLLYPPR